MTIFQYEPWRPTSVAWIPSVDVREEDDRFVVHADLPGVEAKDIEITAEKGVLTLRGERKSESRGEGKGFERVERVAGSFLRRFTLPETANVDGISARHVNGVLEVTIPKHAQVQPKRISVQAA
jgi:HSP20 family protein